MPVRFIVCGGIIACVGGGGGSVFIVTMLAGLLDEHASGLRRFLVGYVGWAEADDCWQDTLLAALEAYPGLRHGGNLRG